MKDLILYIVKGFVSHPDEVEVTEEVNGSEVTLKLKVNDEDMGMVIGKAGQTIKALRKIVTVRAMADNVRVYLQIEEPQKNS